MKLPDVVSVEGNALVACCHDFDKVLQFGRLLRHGEVFALLTVPSGRTGI
ncbi:hypothetical protein RBWH47_05501 [Rhodopirellula baltica WH47]|uniref:Uncharacterized protein n=1 Tax=Rhodopirellula baltica WH47 TaxID=991778 RepID=F2AMI7_RHOBT|nr:hypothetical protein RBWH47_05501 [Rhodopirellula baltica WH47]